MSILANPVIAAFLRNNPNHDSMQRPLVVFDCDGTVIRGDIGEAMFYRQIEEFHFRHSPAQLWPDHPRRSELDDRYQRLVAMPEEKRRTSAEFSPFADILLHWYLDQIASGQVAKACSDIVRLFSGYTVSEVRAFAATTFAEELAAPVARRRLGSHSLPRGVRFLREAVDLIRALQEHRLDIWVVSGSNKWSVEPVFSTFGISEDHVIGLELSVRGGHLTSDPIVPVPVRDGKVPALQRHTTAVPVLVASDSKNDIPLFLYSSGLKVRINSRGRDTADFFQTANVPADESWVLIEHPQNIE